MPELNLNTYETDETNEKLKKLANFGGSVDLKDLSPEEIKLALAYKESQKNLQAKHTEGKFKKVNKPNHTIEEETITQEAAKKILLDTLEIPEMKNLNDFNKILKQATESLPLYQKIKQKIEKIEKENLPYELFTILKSDSDENQTNSNIPTDGVLIKSMRQGKLECAGRTLIASTLLQEHKVNHVVVSAPGHAFLIIEQSPDTLAYFDANNNLFFTFPRTALEGYQGIEKSAECKLKEYIPRKEDFADGANTAFTHFVVMPTKEAVGRQYLGNVSAALDGNEEFKTSGIPINHKASEAIQQLESKIYGKNKVLESFYDRMEELLELEKKQTEDERKTISEILKRNPTYNDFVTAFITLLEGNFGNKIPYIKNASEKEKKLFAKKVWNLLQSRNINKTIRQR